MKFENISFHICMVHVMRSVRVSLTFETCSSSHKASPVASS